MYYVCRYEFRLGVYPTATAKAPLSVPCVIDTAYDFTTIPLHLVQKHRLHVPRLAPADQVQFRYGPGDYLGALWYGFPWNSDTPALAQVQFCCEQCRVTHDKLSHLHFALRDIRSQFHATFDHARDQLVLTPRPGNLGFSPTSP